MRGLDAATVRIPVDLSRALWHKAASIPGLALSSDAICDASERSPAVIFFNRF